MKSVIFNNDQLIIFDHIKKHIIDEMIAKVMKTINNLDMNIKYISKKTYIAMRIWKLNKRLLNNNILTNINRMVFTLLQYIILKILLI